MTNRIHPLLLALIVAAGVVMLIVLGWVFGSSLALLTVFPWLVASLTSSGVPPYLALALALPAAALAAWAVLEALSLNGRKRRRGIAACIVLYSLWASAMWLMTRRYNFDPVTGKSMYNYAATPYGFEVVPTKWKVHPIFGTTAQPMTAEIARAIDLQETMGTSVSPEDALFGPDGSALAWYSETAEDGIELFRTPGRHPRKNIPLRPVTSEIARKLVNGERSVSLNSATPTPSRLEGLQHLRAHLDRARTATTNP